MIRVNGWAEVPLGKLCRLVNGKAFKPSDWTDRGLPIIRIQNLNDTTKPFNYWAGSVDRQVMVNAGDVLLGWSGTPGTSFGAHIWERQQGVLNQHIFRVDLDETRIAKEWAVPAINHQLEVLIGKAHGGVGLRHVKKGEVESLLIPLPPLAEQKRIAGVLKVQLAALERARAAAKAQLAAAKALPAAYLREVFDSDEGRKWPKKPLLEWCEANGQYGTSECACDDPQAGPPVLRMGNLINGRIAWSNLRYMALPQDEEAKYRLRDGDLIFNRTNSAELVGKTAVFEGDRQAVFASYLIRFRIRSDAGTPHFVSAYINSRYGREFIEANMGRAIGQVNVSASVMHKMPIPCPPLERQNAITAALHEQRTGVAAVIRALTSQITDIEAMSASLLGAAFQGRL